MKMLFSFNKSDEEAALWAAQLERVGFIPLNHGSVVDPELYKDSVALDRLYRARDVRLFKLYSILERAIEDSQAEALFVTNCPPYHPDFLQKLKIYRVLYSTDDPPATYMRTIPYLHAYHHVMYCAAGYSDDKDLERKFRECGAAQVDWMPLGVMDFEYRPGDTASQIMTATRDIDVVYVGAFFPQKADLLFGLKKILGKRFQIFGRFGWKRNLHSQLRYRIPAWIRPVSLQERVDLYRRAKIGINIHYCEFALGNQRLFHLPANGVLQISDCSQLMNRVFKDGTEIVTYKSIEHLLGKIEFFLQNERDRRQIAAEGFARTMRDYRFELIADRIRECVRRGITQMEIGTSLTGVEHVIV